MNSNPHDPDPRVSNVLDAFREIFSNLHEGKIVYTEKFTCLARLEDLTLSEGGLQGTIVPLRHIDGGGSCQTPLEPWQFSGPWKLLRPTRTDGFAMPYGGWIIWPGAERVKAVEKCLELGDHEGALALTLLG